MHEPVDPLDPRYIDFDWMDSRDHYIWGHANLDEGLRAKVDYDDYLYFSRWAWCIKCCKRGKLYLRRAVDVRESNKSVKTVSLYLHIEIMKRAGWVPPSPEHVIGDHRNGDSLDCRKINLRWATYAMNNKNVRGSHERDLFE